MPLRNYSLTWGTPTNFNGFCVLAASSSSGRQPNFAALNRVRHLCSAGWPSGWALAHILVAEVFCCFSCLSQTQTQWKFVDNTPLAVIFSTNHCCDDNSASWHSSAIRNINCPCLVPVRRYCKILVENCQIYQIHRYLGAVVCDDRIVISSVRKLVLRLPCSVDSSKNSLLIYFNISVMDRPTDSRL